MQRENMKHEMVAVDDVMFTLCFKLLSYFTSINQPINEKKNKSQVTSYRFVRTQQVYRAQGRPDRPGWWCPGARLYSLVATAKPTRVRR